MRWWWSPLAIHAPWWPLHRRPVRRRAPRRPPAVHTYRRHAVASWKLECGELGIEWQSHWKVIICRSAWMRHAIRWTTLRRSTERWGESFSLIFDCIYGDIFSFLIIILIFKISSLLQVHLFYYVFNYRRTFHYQRHGYMISKQMWRSRRQMKDMMSKH